MGRQGKGVCKWGPNCCMTSSLLLLTLPSPCPGSLALALPQELASAESMSEIGGAVLLVTSPAWMVDTSLLQGGDPIYPDLRFLAFSFWNSFLLLTANFLAFLSVFPFLCFIACLELGEKNPCLSGGFPSFLVAKTGQGWRWLLWAKLAFRVGGRDFRSGSASGLPAGHFQLKFRFRE